MTPDEEAVLAECDIQVFRPDDPSESSAAVRLIHRPTGTIVSATNEATQIANRDLALAMLCARLNDQQRRATIRYFEVIDALRQDVPEFGAWIDASIDDNSGEILPHVIFGDLTRFVLTAWKEAEGETVTRCLSFRDRALRDGDGDVTNLVQVSFVENVGPWDAEVGPFVETWPAALLDEARRQRDWKPGDPPPASTWYRP